MGPLKEDWSRPCPGILEMSQEEREEKCVSQAESFWGTANVARLEEIKRVVDPDELFICNAGIGASSPFIGHKEGGAANATAKEVEGGEGDPATVVNGESSLQTTTAVTTAAPETTPEATDASVETTEAATSGGNDEGSDPVDETKDENTGSPASIYFYSKGVTISPVLAMSLVV